MNPPLPMDFPWPASDPRVRMFYDYWRATCQRCEPGRIPGRQHIEPGEMRTFLPCVVLFDVEREGNRLRFRHRLTGTHFYDLFGHEVTGLYVEYAGSAEDIADIQARFTSVVQTKQPVYGISPVPVQQRSFIKYEHLTVPLAADGITVDMLFGIRCALLSGAARS